MTHLVDDSGSSVAYYSYDPYGALQTSGGEMADINPLRYRGYYYDSEIGRFISPDTTDILTATPMALTDKNLYTYCDNNPVVRVDHGGQFWETVFDVISLGASIVEVCINPADPWAWAGLAGDAIDLIPFVTGVGEVTRAVKTIDKVADVVDTTHDIAKVANRVENVIDTSASGIRYTDKVLKQMNNMVVGIIMWNPVKIQNIMLNVVLR